MPVIVMGVKLDVNADMC